MPYVYENERPELLTDAGQRLFLKIRDHAAALLNAAGAFQMGAVMTLASGTSWQMMAAVDRLVELGELREVTGADIPGQDRVFVKPRSWR